MNKPERAPQDLPLSILKETYRPLAFFVGELLLAAAPFLPESSRSWARRLVRLDVAIADEKRQELSSSQD
jgi:hypothetical protein